MKICPKCGIKKTSSNKSPFCYPCTAKLLQSPVYLEVSKQFFDLAKNGAKAPNQAAMLRQTFRILKKRT